MKCCRTVLLFIGMVLLVSTTVEARQLGGLLKRAKNRAEDKLEQLAEREVEKQVDRQVDKLVEGIWNSAGDAIGSALESALPKSKTSVKVDGEGGSVSREGKPDEPIGLNADGPVDAEYVSYMSVSIVNMPSQLSALTDRLGNATIENVRYHNNRKLSGGDEAGVLIEHDQSRFTYLNHEAANYWSMTYEEMFAFAGGAMDSLRVHMDRMAPPPQAAQAGPSVNAEVDFIMGERKIVRGLDANQAIVVVETTMEGQSEDESAGKLWVIMELWAASSYGGSETLNAFDQRVGQEIFSAMGGADLNSSLDFSAFGDPRLLEGMTEAQEKLDDIAGLPVESNSYFVMTDDNETLDYKAVLDGGLSPRTEEAFVVMLTMQSFISNLSTDPFDPAEVTIPESYTAVAAPVFDLSPTATGQGDSE